jgi:peptide/nickel transport system substrate-binding protein
MDERHTWLHTSLGRRRLLGATAAAGVGATSLWLVGCGGDDDDDDDDSGDAESTATSTATSAATSESTAEATEEGTAAESSPQAGQPKTGGKLNMVWRAEDSHLDPHTSSEHFSAELWRLSSNGLLKQEELTHLPQPDLAESWEQPDELTVVLTVTPGVTWQDKPPVSGRAFVAEDAVYSLERAATPEPDYRRSSSFSSVSAWEAPDETTVRVVLSEAYVPILSAISNKWSVMVAPEVVEQFGDLRSGESIIGTGPFLCDEANSSIGAKLSRNPNYYLPGLPYLDEIEYVTIVDEAARESAFRAGQYDIDMASEADLSLWEGDEDLLIQSYEGSAFGMELIAGKVNEDPFTDIRVRQALDLAIDRDDMARAAWPGSSYKKAALWGNTTWGLPTEEVEARPGYRSPKDEDIAEAISLMEAAGHGGGLNLRLNTTNAYAQYHITRAEALAPQLAKIGVNIEINVLEFGALKEAEVKKDFQYNLATYAYFDDPDFPLYNSLHTNGVRNYWNWSDPEYDALVEQQRGITDIEERREVIYEAQRYVLDQVPVSSDTWIIPTFVLVRNYVKGFKIGDYPWGGTGWFLAETWVDREA